MRQNKIQNYAMAQKIALEAMSPRAQWLDLLDRYFLGTQYEGRPDYWSDKVPEWERAPCFVYQVVEAAIDAIRTKVLGEGRFPDVTTRAAWDSKGQQIPEENAEVLDRALEGCSKQARFQAVCKEALEIAASCSSVAVVFRVQNNRLCLDTVKPQWCTPEWDQETGELVSLEIKYPYIDTSLIERGRVKARAMMYKRVIDTENETTWEPVEIRTNHPLDVEFGPVRSKIAHGFPGCPVHWYAFEKGCSIEGRFDGHAIHETQLGEIDALNFTLSARHGAALKAGQPQWVETGVEPGYNPSEGGRMAHPPIASSPLGGTPNPSTNPLNVSGYLAPHIQKGVRKKGAGYVWQYPSELTRVEMHTLPGDALKAIAETAADERNKIFEALGVQFIDHENLPKGAAMSGTALDALRERFIARCDDIRQDFGDGFIVPLYGMMLQMALLKGLSIPELEKAQSIIADLADVWSWDCPPLELSWGTYSQPTADEQQKTMTMVISGIQAGLITKRVAVKMLRGILGVESIDDYLEELLHESEVTQQDEQGLAQEKSEDAHEKSLELQTSAYEQQLKLQKAKAPK